MNCYEYDSKIYDRDAMYVIICPKKHPNKVFNDIECQNEIKINTLINSSIPLSINKVILTNV